MPQSWCPTCLEHCTDHSSMCTICGDTLINEPSPSSAMASSRAISGSNAANNYMNTSLNERNSRSDGITQGMTQEMIHMLQTRFNSVGTGNDGGLTVLNNLAPNEEWQTPPPEAMNPQPSTTSALSSKTSNKFLDTLKRITVHDHSSILHQAIVTITVTKKSYHGNDTNDTATSKKEHFFQATISEFKPHPPFTIQGDLHVSKPIHGTDAIFTPTQNSNNIHKKNNLPTILFMERGINTFIQKSNNASKLHNVNGIICSNNNSIWPYTMKDSTGKGGSIPIVMIRQTDGQLLYSLLQKQQKQQQQQQQQQNQHEIITSIKAEIKAVKKSNDQNSCIICTEPYTIKEKIIQLPQCNHYFHEECILHWLKSHNTCPFCRVELPLEDEEEEEGRRRRNVSSGSGSGRVGNGNNGGRDGMDGNREQWESIFG